MFSYISLEQRVRSDHPLREIRKLTDEVLRSLSAEFDTLYAESGRPSIAPEYVLRALLLQVFYSVRSERQLVEQIDYNLLFRWFVGWAWTTRCGTMRCSRRTGIGCLPASCNRSLIAFHPEIRHVGKSWETLGPYQGCPADEVGCCTELCRGSFDRAV